MTGKKAVPIVIAVLTYLVTCGTLLWFQLGLYRGTLDTTLLGLLVVVLPAIAVSMLAEKEDRPRGAVAARINNVLLWLVCVWAAFRVVEVLDRSRYDLEAWMCAAALLVAAAVAAVPALEWLRHNQWLLIALLYATLLAATLLFLAVRRPVTVRGAERLVEQAGYEEAAYRASWPRSDMRLITSHGILELESLDENSWGYYWLSAQKGGEVYAVAVSVAEGRICAAEKQDGNAIQYW